MRSGESSWGAHAAAAGPLPPLTFTRPPPPPPTEGNDATAAATSVPAALFAMLTPLGIYHGVLSLSLSHEAAVTTVVMDSANLIPYALPAPDMPQQARLPSVEQLAAGDGSDGSDDEDDEGEEWEDNSDDNPSPTSSTAIAGSRQVGAGGNSNISSISNNFRGCQPRGLVVTDHHFLVLADVAAASSHADPRRRRRRRWRRQVGAGAHLLLMSRLDGRLVCSVRLAEDDAGDPASRPPNPFDAFDARAAHHLPLHSGRGGDHRADHGSVFRVAGRPVGLTACVSEDSSGSPAASTTCVLHTDRSVVAVVLDDEASFVWRTYLDKALASSRKLRATHARGHTGHDGEGEGGDRDENGGSTGEPADAQVALAAFRAALSFCRQRAERACVLRAQAEFLLSMCGSSAVPTAHGQDHAQAAALCFAEARAAFDEVVLRLLRVVPAAEQRTSSANVEWRLRWLQSDPPSPSSSSSSDATSRWPAVQHYLQELLVASADAGAATDPAANLTSSTRTMVATWLLELMLQGAAHLDRRLARSATPETQAALQGALGELKDFLRRQRGVLDQATTAALLRSHCAAAPRSAARSLPLFHAQQVP